MQDADWPRPKPEDTMRMLMDMSRLAEIGWTAETYARFLEQGVADLQAK